MTSAQLVWDMSRAALNERPGYVAVLKVYMDESGTHEGSPVVTVAALVALAQTWRDWTKQWNIHKRPIGVFHANDCANFHGEFEGWEKDDRDAYVAQLLPVIGQAKIVSFVVGIRMDDYRRAIVQYPGLKSLVGETPHTACFQWVVQSIMEMADALPKRDRFAFFHEINDYQADAVRCFEWAKAKDDRMISLTFGGKNDYVPLQAADAVAYEGNKRLRNPDAPNRRAWTALNPKGEARSLQYFDEAALKRMMFRKIGLLPSEQFAP